MTIRSVGPQQAALVQANRPTQASSSREAAQDFQEVLKAGVQRANQQVQAGDQAVEEMVQTQGANLHETMIALEKADIATRLTAKVGQKLVQAYKEISQMQV